MVAWDWNWGYASVTSWGDWWGATPWGDWWGATPWGDWWGATPWSESKRFVDQSLNPIEGI